MQSLNDFDFNTAARRLAERERANDLACSQRRQRAIAWSKEIAFHLGTLDPTLQKIIGFGSTFETWRAYRLDSDIDLAIVGGHWSFLMRSIPPGEFDVSLVELPHQNSAFIRHVEQHGVMLYEKQ